MTAIFQVIIYLRPVDAICGYVKPCLPAALETYVSGTYVASHCMSDWLTN
jgi:hypothetical protein